LFHYSCLRYVGQAPIVVVHKDDAPLLPGFERIAARGGRVQTAPNYRWHGGVHYPPRNTAATLRHVRTQADYLVLCDPDMLFLRPLPWHEGALTSRQVSFDKVSYLDPDSDVYQPALDQTCRSADVDPQRLRAVRVSGGVPHVIPVALQQSLSDQWLHCLELFPTIVPQPGQAGGWHDGPHKDWLATMWAVILAVHRLDLEPVMTDWCLYNVEGGTPQPPPGPGGPAMIHYCYGDATFNKRTFGSIEAAQQGVWQVPAPDDASVRDGTVSGTIRRQLYEAREFYGIQGEVPQPTAKRRKSPKKVEK
jgi:hypothetical protein